jgi:hypothetical protein
LSLFAQFDSVGCFILCANMARTLPRHFGQGRPCFVKEKRFRNPCVRAVAIDVPNALPDELDATPDEQSMYAQFDELLKGTITSFKAGAEVRGTVVDVSRRGAFVDIGGKGAAYIPTENLSIAPIVDVRSNPQVQQTRHNTRLSSLPRFSHPDDS